MKPPAVLLAPLFLLAGLAAARGLAVQEAEAKKPVTVFLVRHAETSQSTLDARDPPLSEAGQERARALARLLAKAGASHLYSSQFQRARDTLAPLAESSGLQVVVIPAEEGDRQAAELKKLPPGAVAVVAGHSNSVPGLVAALGGEIKELAADPRFGDILGHDAFDRMFVVTLPGVAGAAVQTIELRYGN